MVWDGGAGSCPAVPGDARQGLALCGEVLLLLGGERWGVALPG